MSIIYIEAPNKIPASAGGWPTVFLAGGITNCHDWQSELVSKLDDLDAIILNPRRKDFDINKKEESKLQIEWEHNALKMADIISFWFSHETVQPITLFELGMWFKSSKNILVGADENYPRRFDLEIQLPLYDEQPTIPGSHYVLNSLDDLADRIRMYVLLYHDQVEINDRLMRDFYPHQKRGFGI